MLNDQKAIALKLKRLSPGAIRPTYSTDGSGCFDIYVDATDWTYANQEHGKSMWAGASTVFNTGWAFEIPPGYVMLVFSRSGHGFGSAGMRLSNCVGVIDSDYRGELKIKLRADDNGINIKAMERIAQAMLVEIPRVILAEVTELSDTARGAGGFGSTGA